MAKFSLARVPYYISVIAFMICVALVSFWNNTKSRGLASDFYLVMMVLAIILALASAYYLFAAQSGDDDEVGIEVAGVGIGKQIYYGGVLLMATWRVIAGFGLNHSGVGISSTYGMIWLFAGLAIGLFTYANYRSYRTKPVIPTKIA
jgi:hypothetical protein